MLKSLFRKFFSAKKIDQFTVKYGSPYSPYAEARKWGKDEIDKTTMSEILGYDSFWEDWGKHELIIYDFDINKE